MLLSCEARARVIQQYHPQLSKTKAAVELGKRQHLLSCEDNTLFRPSDIMVGADGALYVSDWFDSGVGGHRAADTTHYGTIYRLAPKGFKPSIPMRKNDPIEDAISLLKSPAVHVRYTGFEKLKVIGTPALPDVLKLTQSDHHWHAARAVSLLPYLGERGIEACLERLNHSNAEQRILAFRALRSTGSTIFLKEGGQIDGLLYSELDPVSIMSTGGIQQMVPRSRIKNIRRRNKTSLMLFADQLGFSVQELADLAAFMVNLNKTSDQVTPKSSLFEE
ncbi:MAG: hypothetical protein HOH33_16635 [Verrucomicrobia bacterium]|jgi:hypothetical protein|nr:hypothetical protein [Verrucomicrobiota bacterium]